VAADSNGLFHGLGDHASNSFSVDNQPITDQQSKIFSNQIPVDSIESLEVIPGAPPAEYGGKTSLVIVATTPLRAGRHDTARQRERLLRVVLAHPMWVWTWPMEVNSGGTSFSVNGLNSGRFLDPPEFVVMHDKGNEENVFDRIDYRLSTADSIRLNLGFSRSWFRRPTVLTAKIRHCGTAWSCEWGSRSKRQRRRPHRPTRAN